MRLQKLFLFLSLFLFISCIEEPYEVRTNFQPILMTRTQLERSVVWQQPREFLNTGKIYTKGNYIFINEKYKGVHIINNSNPSSPRKEGFITAPGCIDIAVKDNSLYIDNAVDLVAIDITNFNSIVVTERIKNAFSELLPPDADQIPRAFKQGERPENTVIVGWEEKHRN